MLKKVGKDELDLKRKMMFRVEILLNKKQEIQTLTYGFNPEVSQDESWIFRVSQMKLQESIKVAVKT